MLAVFGDAEAKAIKPEHVRRYMDARGKRSRVQANHEHSSMSRVYRWGYQRGYVPDNPCVGVDKFPKPQRDRYITDEEYIAIFTHATPAVKAAMEIAYLCAARVSDVLKMNWNQILDKGIFIQQGKTGIKQIKAWTERLSAAVDICRNGDRMALLSGQCMVSVIHTRDLMKHGEKRETRLLKNLVGHLIAPSMI